jgi:hypothetical protein
MDKILALPRDEGFIYRVIALMEEENARDLNMLIEEEKKREEARRQEYLEWKRAPCPKCGVKQRPHQFNTTPSVVYPAITILKYPLYGVHIEGKCNACNYVEIF